MDTLWAPWRIGYIRRINKTKSCLLCRVARSKNNTKDLVVFRTPHSFVMLNLYPYNNGHLMVCPKKHVKTLDALNAGEITDLMNAVNKATALLDKTLSPQGYNIGINIGRVGGAGIENHIHVHIVPRWNGDTNFMPTVFSTKIIGQSLSELHQQLTSQCR